MGLFIPLCAFLLFCLMVIKMVKKSKPVKLPPGPRKLPIIGNLHQLRGSLPHPILADMAKKYGPLMHLQLGEISNIVVSSADVAKDILNKCDIIFGDRPTLTSTTILTYNNVDIAFSPYGEYWRQLRKICTIELLSAKRVQTFRSIRESESSDLVKSISSQAGSVVNVTKALSSHTFTIAARAAFGKKNKHQEEFLSYMEDLLAFLSEFNIADLFPSVKILRRITGFKHRLVTMQKKVDKILDSILEEHRAKRKESGHGSGEQMPDIVDVLLDIQKSGEFGAPLSDENLKAVVFDMFGAGGESSSTTMTWAFAEMIRNPRALKKAQDEVRQVFGDIGNVDESRIHELKYLQAVIKEAMRLHPIGPLITRESREKCEYQGYEIPVKTRLMINAWTIQRDPKQWTEPEKFIPERFLDSELDFGGNNYNYMPFGAGRRVCVGIKFAVPNLQLLLAQLLFHFDWKIPGGLKPEELDLTEFFGAIVKRKEDLRLIPVPHYPSSI